MNININLVHDSITKELKDTQELHFYMFNSAIALSNYTKLLNTPVKMSFTGKVSNNNKKLKELSIIYLKIAQQYTKNTLDIPKDKIKEITCPNCKEDDFEIDGITYICLNCGCQFNNGLAIITTDTTGANILTKQVYDKFDTFETVMETFPFDRDDHELVTLLIKDFKNLDTLFSKVYPSNNFPYMPFVLYKLLQKHNYTFVEKLPRKIINKKSELLKTLFLKLDWTY